MTLKNLDNLVNINQLKQEPPDQAEFNGLVASAKRRLKDAQAHCLIPAWHRHIPKSCQ